MADEPAAEKKEPLAFLSGIFIPVLVLSLIFGGGGPGIFAVMLGLVAAGLALFPDTRRKLEALASDRQARQVMSLLIPVVAVVGIFGPDQLLALVLGMAIVALLIATLTSSTKVAEFSGEQLPQADFPEPVRPALPAQASGEAISEIDVRALCRGLPPTLAGQVMATVEHLELVAAEAQRNGDARRQYDARQGLQDYLPNTVRAWKAQPEHQRNEAELDQALAQVRDIAGPDDREGKASRRAWETQQRFLAARSGKDETDSGDP